jgi:hypothetical protein
MKELEKEEQNIIDVLEMMISYIKTNRVNWIVSIDASVDFPITYKVELSIGCEKYP